jgi:hypothetical protein
MQCKRGDLCPAKSAVSRQEAVQAVCARLTELIQLDGTLIEETVCQSQQLDTQGDSTLRAELVALEKREKSFGERIHALLELVGCGSEQDRQEVRAKLQGLQAERVAVQVEITRIRRLLEAGQATITPERACDILAHCAQLFEDGAAGRLGDDAVYRALSVFRQLTGGRIWVHVERRPKRKSTNVRGIFRPNLLATVQRLADLSENHLETGGEVSVWLRPPPRLDQLAERVHQLIDIDGLPYREAAHQLQKEGHKVNSGNVWYSYRRWYEMNDLPAPKRAYNSGRPRRKTA